MLAKWITLDVDPSERAAFCAAQAAPNDIARARGFVAQMGGWLNPERTKAGVLSLWTDMLRYQLYMRSLQAGVALGPRAYFSGSMALALELPAPDGRHLSLAAAAKGADVLRISDCRVERPQMARFIAEQRAGLGRASAASGFVGGSLMRVAHDDPRFLTASLWEGSLATTNDSLMGSLPSFRTSVATEAARGTLTVARVELIPAWRVLAS